MQHEAPVGGKTTWSTPDWLLEEFGPFDFDPCPNFLHPGRCARHHCPKGADGLEISWAARGFKDGAFVNPPFGKGITRWFEKADEEEEEIESMFLVPGRVETEWFHQWIWDRADAILFFEHRVQYLDPETLALPVGEGGKKKSCGFPSVLVAFGPMMQGRLLQRGGKYGKVIVP
jgi:hypothetical protein